MRNNITFIFRKNDKEAFDSRYTEYLSNNLMTHRYDPDMLNYRVEQSRYLVTDESFVILLDNKCVGGAFIPIESVNGTISITLNGDYTIAPIFSDLKFARIIFEKIDEIAALHNAKQIKFFIDTLLKVYGIAYNHLLPFGYLDASSNDCYIDLRNDEARLWTNIRSSYKNLINKIIKSPDYAIIFADHYNPDKTVHDQYVDLHATESNKSRKSFKTYDMQYDMLRKDKGAVFILLENNRPIGGIYCLHSKKTVTYASGAKEKETPIHKAVLHTLVWHAIKYYRSRNYDFFHLSSPCGFGIVDGFNNYYDEKQINISDFKRAMGAEVITYYRGIKYLDRDLLIEDANNFKYKLAENYNVSV